jgi:hypothetical protein
MKTPVAENEERQAFPRGMSMFEFCRAYGLGRTTAYKEVKSGRRRALKAGRRTIISREDAESWLRSLPAVGELAS